MFSRGVQMDDGRSRETDGLKLDIKNEAK